MRRTALALMLGVVSVSLATGFVAPPEPAKTQALYPELRVFYEDLHRNPELGYQEVRTAAKLAEKLRALGYEVTTGVGKTGVVAVLKNGKGPTVLLRADMDALPMEEKTGLPYASVATSKDDRGETVKVMHGCGHDVHVTTLVGAAALLARGEERVARHADPRRPAGRGGRRRRVGDAERRISRAVRPAGLRPLASRCARPSGRLARSHAGLCARQLRPRRHHGLRQGRPRLDAALDGRSRS